MTWNEFKAEVERQLAERGISGDIVLLHIDVPGDGGLNVRTEEMLVPDGGDSETRLELVIS